MVCLDTDVIINFLRKDKETISLLKEIKETDKLATTTINSFELWKGFYKTGRDKKTIINLLDSISLLKLDDKSSQKSAEIFEDLNSKGKMVDVLDVMIASIAITNNEPLLTFNKKHFERIEGLQLV